MNGVESIQLAGPLMAGELDIAQSNCFHFDQFLTICALITKPLAQLFGGFSEWCNLEIEAVRISFTWGL